MSAETFAPVRNDRIGALQDKVISKVAQLISTRKEKTEKSHLLPSSLLSKTHENINYQHVEERSQESRKNFWTGKKDISRETKQAIWNESVSTWIHTNTEEKTQNSEEVISALNAVDIQVYNKDQNLSEQIDQFYDNYLKKKSNVKKFVEDVSKDLINKKGAVDLHRLEKRLTAIKGLLSTFGHNDVPELIEEYALAHGLFSQNDQEKEKLLAPHLSTFIKNVPNSRKSVEQIEEPKSAVGLVNKEKPAISLLNKFKEKSQEATNKASKKVKKINTRPQAGKDTKRYKGSKKLAAVVAAGSVLFGGVFAAKMSGFGEGENTSQVQQYFSNKAQQDAQEVLTGSAACEDVCNEEHVHGPISTKQKENKIYQATFFGYSSKEQENDGKVDTEDNHTAKYENLIPECNVPGAVPLSGKDCEEKVQWFTAGAGGQFKPNDKIEITNDKGAKVIARAIDEGPDIGVQRRDGVAKFDMSYDAYKYLGNPVKVKAEKVPDEIADIVPLGPIEMDTLGFADSREYANLFPGERVLYWSRPITQHLELGYNNKNSKMLGNIENNGYHAIQESGENMDNKYWCTWLIVDAYNLAGYKGLNVIDHGSVTRMRQWWMNQGKAQGYTYQEFRQLQNSEERNNVINHVRPGDAMFMEEIEGVATQAGNEHVALVEKIYVDENGNKKLVTKESNASAVTKVYDIDAQGNILGTVWPVSGFGGPPQHAINAQK